MTSLAAATTVLIVDDDVSLAQLIARKLKRKEITSALAHSGKAAIEWLTENSAALLLLDLKLPDIPAGQFITNLESIQPGLPFIIVTGQGDERIAVDMMKRGARDYLVKDVQFLDFVPNVVQQTLQDVQNEKRFTAAENMTGLTESVVEQTYSGVLIISPDLPEPLISYINPAFASLIGAKVADLVGSPLRALEAVIGPWPLLRNTLAEHKEFLGETQFRRADGAELILGCTITTVQASNGTASHLAVIVRDITDSKRLEREIVDIAEREQNRIGRDLHDGLGQQLSALELFTVSLAQDLATQAPQLLQPLRQMDEQLREAIRQTRGLARGLAPISFQKGGLTAALTRLSETTTAMAKIKCNFHWRSGVELSDATKAIHLYRIAQEAVNNAVRHGKAAAIDLSLERMNGSLHLTVQDNGFGFSLNNPAEGMGLAAMRYRADLIGATFTIDSQPGKGTHIHCRLPEPK